MAYDIGPKIGIEGEAKFRSAINDINANMKTLGTEMQVVASQFDKNDTSIEAYSEKNKVLNKQIDLQKEKLEELKKGLTAAADKYGESDKVTQGWQQAVNKATADLNVMSRDLTSNEDAINKATDELAKMDTELGQTEAAMNEMAKETSDATDKTNKFGTAIKEAIKNAAKTSVKVAATSIAAVGTASVAAAAGAFKLASDAGEAADELLTLSAQTGITTEELQEMQYASEFVDVPLETMTGSMAKLTKNMSGAKDGTGTAAEAFKTLGVSITDSNGELLSNQDVWASTLDALGNVANETERDALAMSLFGKSAQDLNPLIKAGSDELARLGEEAHTMGAVLSDESLASAGKFDDMLQKVKASATGAATQLGVAVMPAVSTVLSAVTDIMPQIATAISTGDWSGATTAITGMVQGLLTNITAVLPDMAGVATTILTSLVTMLVSVIPSVVPILVETAVTLINTLAQLLVDQGPTLVQTGVNALFSFLEGAYETFPLLIEAAISIVLALVDSLIENLPTFIPAAIEMIMTVVKGLIDALPKLIEAAFTIIEALTYALIDNLPLLVDAAIEIITKLVLALGENLPMLVSATLKIMLALAAGLIAAIPQLIAAIPKILTSLKDTFEDYDWNGVGKAIIDGIKTGVKNAAKALATSVKDAASGALTAAKNFLGIHSPSTVMRDQVGLQIGAGMAEGIEDSAKQVNAAMSVLNKHVTDNDLSISTTNGTGVSGTGTIVIQNRTELDGKILTTSTSKVQAGFNKGKSRALGVVR